MLNLLLNSSKIAINGKTAIEAVGGTPPYSYSLVIGGDGGSISDGVYTAPNFNNLGFQTIQVTDSLGARATATVYILDNIQLICSIIQQFMGLQDDQVYVYNQKFIIPKDDRLYISVGVQGAKCIGNNSKFIDGVEYQYASMQNTLSINIMSKNFLALSRKEEVLMALKSSLSQRVQTSNSFKIASIPASINDVSGVDGALIPYRFNVSINILYGVTKQSSIDYFDDFNYELETNE